MLNELRLNADQALTYYITGLNNRNMTRNWGPSVDVDNVAYKLRLESQGMADFQIKGMGSAWLFEFEATFHLPPTEISNGWARPVKDQGMLSIVEFLESVAFRPHENIGGTEERVEACQDFAKQVANKLRGFADDGLRVLDFNNFTLIAVDPAGGKDNAEEWTFTISLTPVLRQSIAISSEPLLGAVDGWILLGMYALVTDQPVDLGEEEQSAVEFLSKHVLSAIQLKSLEGRLPEEDGLLRNALSYFDIRYCRMTVKNVREELLSVRTDALQALFESDAEAFGVAYDRALRQAFGGRK